MSSVSPKISKKRSFHSFNEKRNENRNDKGKSKSKKEEDPLEFDESYFDESDKHLQTKKARIEGKKENHKEIIKEIIHNNYDDIYNDKEVKNECIICGVDMGPDNPRQLCFKTFCPDEKI